MVDADLFTESFLIPSVLFPALVTACRTFFMMERSSCLVGLGFFLDIPQSRVLFAKKLPKKGGFADGSILWQQGWRQVVATVGSCLQLGSQILSFAGIVSVWHQKNCKASPLWRVNGLDLTIYFNPHQRWSSSSCFPCSNPQVLLAQNSCTRARCAIEDILSLD